MSGEDRGRGCFYYKLRFRCRGQQHVRYLGSDAAVADRVRAELAKLQAAARLDRELGRLARGAKRILRNAKSRLEPLVQDAGYGFHGLSVRRRIHPRPHAEGQKPRQVK